ncbi:MAG: hypothetical protein ABR585_15125, partial [Gemmatimonadaceae bacterium]
MAYLIKRGRVYYIKHYDNGKKSRISTGTGDDGTTGLAAGGARVPKTSARVALVGAIDEANDALGLAAALATR